MRRELANATRTLVTGFIVWKLLLFALASVSPGIGYDTSTSLLFNDVNQLPAKRNGLAGARDSAHGPILRIVRWDAIYFVKTAERGHLYEQEWAFSWALARFISFVAHCKSQHPSASQVPLAHHGQMSSHAVIPWKRMLWQASW
jgi:GPI mannosyltransferase 2